MPNLTIVKYGDPILRRVLPPVERVTPELLAITEDMFEAMHLANGVGLAANQAGFDRSFAVIEFREVRLQLFNPRIIDRRGTQRCVEGCLSVPGVDGEVTRADEVTAVYLDEEGHQIERTFTGHLARIVQHEVDHLNGIMIVDHLSVAVKALHKKTLERLKEESQQRKVGTR